MENLDSFLTTVDEFVDDENKIVTCKWLSRQLVLQVNQARKILEAYVKGRRNENGINIVYTLIGRDSNGMCIKVVRDGDLDSAKSKLNQILSVSIYSVQKTKLQDSSILYAADYDSNRENLHENSRFGGITYEGATRLTKDEIKRRTSTSTTQIQSDPAAVSTSKKPVSSEKSKTPQQKANFFAKLKTSPPAVKKEDVASVEVQGKPPQPRDSPAKKQKKPTGMAAFIVKGKSDPFTKSQMKQSVKKEPEKDSREPEPQPKKEEKKKMRVPSPEAELDDELRIDDFPVDDDFVKDTKKKPKAKQESPQDSKNDATEKKPTTNAKTKNISKPTKNSKKSRRKDSNDLPAKKRRRIQAMSSSSGSEDEDEEMDIIPPSPPPVAEPAKEEEAVEEAVSRDLSNEGKNKRKKKVIKSKTYVDEDGCMVTEKVVEYESCSSGDEDPVANGDTKPEEKKKKFPAVSTAQPKKNTKQASIMGFFKKK